MMTATHSSHLLALPKKDFQVCR